jgi:hypothetical protein
LTHDKKLESSTEATAAAAALPVDSDLDTLMAGTAIGTAEDTAAVAAAGAPLVDLAEFSRLNIAHDGQKERFEDDDSTGAAAVVAVVVALVLDDAVFASSEEEGFGRVDDGEDDDDGVDDGIEVIGVDVDADAFDVNMAIASISAALNSELDFDVILGPRVCMIECLCNANATSNMYAMGKKKSTSDHIAGKAESNS